MKSVFPSEWRTQNRAKRRFYSRYMRWLEVLGFATVGLVFASFIYAFTYRVDDLIVATDVPIQMQSTPMTATQDFVILGKYVEDGALVQKGQPLLEVVPSEAISGPPWRGRKYAVIVLKAASGGILSMPDLPTSSLGKGVEFASVLDPNTLVATASLKGATVDKASVGQPASVTAIQIPSASQTIVRASGERTEALSGSLLGPELKQELSKGLVGKPVRGRNDIPLRIQEISGVEVEANLALAPPTAILAGAPLDPPNPYRVSGTVTEGTPVATVQISDLPESLAKAAEQRVQSAVVGRNVTDLDGKSQSIQSLSNLRFLIKAKVSGTATVGNDLAGTVLDRAFEAKVTLVSPPTFLVEAVRRSLKTGKPVTARVEVRTGSRPIALMLLKKS